MWSGIKYELLRSPDVPRGKRAAPPRPQKKPKPKPKPAGKVRPEKTEPPAIRKVVAFEPPDEDDDEDEAIAELKKQVRHAMPVPEERPWPPSTCSSGLSATNFTRPEAGC